MKSPLGGTHGIMFLLLKSVIRSASLFIASTFLQFLLTWRAYFFIYFQAISILNIIWSLIKEKYSFDL